MGILLPESSQLMQIIVHLLVCVLLCVVLYLVASSVRFKRLLSRRKERTFECGFDPIDSRRIPFSLRFFLLGVIFLIFDIEVVLLIPLLLGTKACVNSYMPCFVFGVVLILGLFHE